MLHLVNYVNGIPRLLRWALSDYNDCLQSCLYPGSNLTSIILITKIEIKSTMGYYARSLTCTRNCFKQSLDRWNVRIDCKRSW